MTERAIRIRARVVYVVETERQDLGLVGCGCGHFESAEMAWDECAGWIVFNAYPNLTTDAEHDRAIELRARLARLLAYWNRERSDGVDWPEPCV